MTQPRSDGARGGGGERAHFPDLARTMSAVDEEIALLKASARQSPAYIRHR
jgi:hypothetical protein